MQQMKAKRISFNTQLTEVKKQPLERFYEYLPSWPFCMKSTKVNQYCFQLPKEEAIKCPNIQLNKLCKAYLCFDIDQPDAASAHKNAGLPKPTLIVVNPENGHAHIYYELLNPVIFTERGHQKPKLFFLTTQEAFRIKLGGDPNFNRVMAKNPFWNTQNNGKWELFINNKTYLLKTLSNYVELTASQKIEVTKKYYPFIEQTVNKGERNSRLFHDARYFSYRVVKDFNSFVHLYNEIFVHCETVNKRFCKPPLSYPEIESISKSVCNWTWNNRLHFKKYKQKKRGACGLEPTTDWMEGIEWEIEKKRRQRIGAKYTHSLKRQKTEKAINQAIEELIMEGQKISKTAVAKKIGMTRENISRRYGHLFWNL